MIRKFNIFQDIKENKYEDYHKEYGSLGEYVEYLQGEVDDKERFAQILGKYLKSNTDVRVSKAVNVLPEVDQRFLIRELERELSVTENVAEVLPPMTAGEEMENDIKDTTLSGRWGFNSFIKVISALNLPEIKPDMKNCPKDFAIYYAFNQIDKDRLASIMDRFRSLNVAKKMLEESDDSTIGVYFGVRFDSRFYVEYGLLIDDTRKVFGEFKFGKRQLTTLRDSKSKSLQSFKDEIQKTSLNDLKLLMKVKSDLSNFSPGFYHRKSNAAIQDSVLVQAYYGLGNWDNGMMKHDEIDKLKAEFKEWILTQRWRKKVVLSIKADKFWVYFKIKVRG